MAANSNQTQITEKIFPNQSPEQPPPYYPSPNDHSIAASNHPAAAEEPEPPPRRRKPPALVQPPAAPTRSTTSAGVIHPPGCTSPASQLLPPDEPELWAKLAMTFIESQAEPQCIMESNSLIVGLSKGCVEMGYTREQVQGRGFLDLLTRGEGCYAYFCHRLFSSTD